MFIPNRLVFRRLDGVKTFITDDIPEYTGYVLDYPGEVLRETGNALQLESEAIRLQFQGLLHGVMEGVVEDGVERLVWEDLLAAPKKLGYELGGSVKGMTWDTAGDLLDGNYTEAAKSFAVKGLLGTIASPFKAAWWGVKGLYNGCIDTVHGVASLVSHTTGVQIQKGELGLRKHGFLSALGASLKGLGVALTVPLGTRLRERISKSLFEGNVSRSDVSMTGSDWLTSALSKTTWWNKKGPSAPRPAPAAHAPAAHAPIAAPAGHAPAAHDPSGSTH